MPTFVVKPERERDFYVLWSTVVDNVVGVGDAATVLGFEGDPGGRLSRANEYGTSALDAKSYGWDYGKFIVCNMGRPGAFWLQRKDLIVFALLLVEDRADEAMRFLTEIED